MWDEEISERAHVGTTTHQGTPGVLARLGVLCPPAAPPSDVICTKNSEIFRKNRIKFSRHSGNFYFWVFFYCMVKSENRQNKAFYFIN